MHSDESHRSGGTSGIIDHHTFIDFVGHSAIELGPGNAHKQSTPVDEDSASTSLSSADEEDLTTVIYDVETTVVGVTEDDLSTLPPMEENKIIEPVLKIERDNKKVV